MLEFIEVETAANLTVAVIWLHGLGADGNDFVPIVEEIDLTGCPPIRFIFPHAAVRPVTVNNGYRMRAWYDSQASIEELIAAQNARGIPTERIVLAGFSQGCAMTLQTGLRHPQKLAGLMCLSGYLPLAAMLDAERSPANQSTPIFMAHGRTDPVVPMARATASRELLEECGYTVEWHDYPMPHSVCPQEIADIGVWMRRVLA
jgi:phospholipase/carboxylesterase